LADGEHQLELTLPGVPAVQRTSKLWIIAPESQVAPRDSEDGDAPWISHAARHCFVSADHGIDALGPSDLLLVRCDKPEQFRLLVPDGLVFGEQEKFDLARWIERALRRGSLSGVRAQPIDQLTCLSFQRGETLPRGAERHLRSRLERALARLGNPSDDASPSEALHEYRVARRLLDSRSHNALDGLLRNASAGVLGRVHAVTGAIDYGTQSRAQFASARNLYIKAGLLSEARTAYQNSSTQTARLQGCLPFYREQPDSPIDDRAVEITPVVAMAILLPAIILPPIRKRPAVPHYVSAGKLHVRDMHLCRIVAGDRSGRRKLVARVASAPGGFAISAGHVDAMTALLRLTTINPLCDDVLAMTFSSPSLDFDEPLFIADSGRTARVLARPTRAGPHDIGISMHMSDGRSSTLPFSIPDKIERQITYV